MNPKDLWVVYNRLDNNHHSNAIHSVWVLESDAVEEMVKLNRANFINSAVLPRYSVTTLQNALFGIYSSAHAEGFKEGRASIKGHTEDDERL